MDTSRRVVVAEDNPNLRKVIVNIVRKLGFKEVQETEDGEDAWEIVEDGGIGLVLADWSMPTTSGLDLLKRIRGASDEAIREIPFLMITAKDTKDSIVNAGKHGVDAYVIKPFSVKTIEEKIQEALDNRAAQ